MLEGLTLPACAGFLSHRVRNAHLVRTTAMGHRVHRHDVPRIAIGRSKLSLTLSPHLFGQSIRGQQHTVAFRRLAAWSMPLKGSTLDDVDRTGYKTVETGGPRTQGQGSRFTYHALPECHLRILSVCRRPLVFWRAYSPR